MIISIEGNSQKNIKKAAFKISSLLNLPIIPHVDKSLLKKRYNFKGEDILFHITLLLEKFKRIEDAAQYEKGAIVLFSVYRDLHEIYEKNSEEEIDIFNFYFFSFLEKFPRIDFQILITNKNSKLSDFFNRVSRKENLKLIILEEDLVLKDELNYKNVVKSIFEV